MAFKMKGHSLPGPHQRKSPATQKDDGSGGSEDNQNPMDLSGLSDEKLIKAIKRNMNPEIVGGRTYDLNTDTISAGTLELQKRHEEQSKEKKKPTPAKIAPLVMMGAQMLGKKMMEKKQEKDSPATQKSPAKAKKAKKESSPEMKAKVKKFRDQNFIDTNKALAKTGKPALSRAKYDASLK